jgi:hypothetical protein
VSPAQFPIRRPDGSFCIEIVLRVEAETSASLGGQVVEWLDAWVQSNQSWHWFGQDIRYDDEFAGNPFHVEYANGLLSFRLEGKPTARWWKDFLGLRLLKDLQQAFPSIRAVEKMQDCPG